MASPASRDTKTPLNNMIECSICRDKYRDPRILPCVHTFCFKCIQGFCKDKKVGDEVGCPLCRNKFNIPEDGVEGLSKNSLVEHLTEVADVSTATCDGCSSGENDQSNEKKPATMFCVECREGLCADCVDIHGRVKLTRSHGLVKIGDGEDSDVAELAAKLARNYCEKHREEALKWFCYDCKSAICVTCFFESHDSHKYTDVNGVADEFRSQMKNDITALGITIDKCRNAIAEQRTDKAAFNRVIDKVEREICDRAEQLKQQIEREKQCLLIEMDTCKKDRIKQIDHVVDDVEQHLSFSESLVDYTKELSRKGTPGEVIQQSSNVHTRASDLLKIDRIMRAVSDLGSMQVSFTPATWPTPVSGNIVGKVNKANVVKTPILTNIIPSKEKVVSLTSILDELFVLCDPHQQQIEVFSTSTFQLNRTLRLDGLGDGWCRMTSCPMFQCLYISDCDESTVLKVHPNNVTSVGKLIVIEKWQVGKGPRALSVNRENNVVITCHSYSQGISKIQEYTTHGKLIHEMYVPRSEVTEPLHAIHLPKGHYAVSHWGPAEGVSVVDRGGRVVSTFRNDPQSTRRRFNGAGYLAIAKQHSGSSTTKDYCILVADSGNNRVVILNSSLTRECDLPLLLDDGLKDPWCLCFDESRGRLYVGEHEGRRSLVFDNVINIDV